jgi:hypothetical protein
VLIVTIRIYSYAGTTRTYDGSCCIVVHASLTLAAVHFENKLILRNIQREIKGTLYTAKN